MDVAYVHIYYTDDHKIKETLVEKIGEIHSAIKYVLKEGREAEHYEKVLVISTPLDFAMRSRSKDRMEIEVIAFIGYCRNDTQQLSEELVEKLSPLLPFPLSINVFNGSSGTANKN